MLMSGLLRPVPLAQLLLQGKKNKIDMMGGGGEPDLIFVSLNNKHDSLRWEHHRAYRPSVKAGNDDDDDDDDQ